MPNYIDDPESQPENKLQIIHHAVADPAACAELLEAAEPLL